MAQIEIMSSSVFIFSTGALQNKGESSDLFSGSRPYKFEMCYRDCKVLKMSLEHIFLDPKFGCWSLLTSLSRFLSLLRRCSLPFFAKTIIVGWHFLVVNVIYFQNVLRGRKYPSTLRVSCNTLQDAQIYLANRSQESFGES